MALRPESEQEREKREREALDPWRKMAVEAQYSKLLKIPLDQFRTSPAVLLWLEENLTEWLMDLKGQTRIRVSGILHQELLDLGGAVMADNFAQALAGKLWGEIESLSEVMEEEMPPDRIFSEILANSERQEW